ncbi:MAG TPA: energy transducer TonB [Candidatus Sulfotelmatobacter sp.]|nr:energy transducer TonB [Candidatus Sulfotelmatobacter sp.]
MKTLFLFASVASAILVCLICPIALSAGQGLPLNAATSTAGDFPQNTAGNLRVILSDFLVAAKSDDQGRVWSKIADLEIPDYENWFRRTYGQEKGQALATEYGKFLKANEQQFELLWMELAKQEGEISITRLDAANHRFASVNADDVLSDPTEVFAADWKKTDTSAGPASQPIGSFCFVDGTFRLKVFAFHQVRILSSVKSGPVVPGKLIDRVQPAYPEEARKLGIRGLVSLNVVIHKDGSVTVENVGAGHPLLAPAARTAVQQWKYQPTTIGGEPVDVETKIYVTFDLSQQKQ